MHEPDEATPARRLGRPSQGAREALIKAAREAFTERDFADVSTGEVLARAGVSRGAMYHHFPSKTELFRGAYWAMATEVFGPFARLPASPGGPFATLREGCRLYLRECASNRELQRLGLRQARAVLGWEEWSRAEGKLGIRAMAAGVKRAQAAGELETADVDTTARLLLGVLIEAGLLIANSPDPEARLEEIEPEALRFVDGLRIRG